MASGYCQNVDQICGFQAPSRLETLGSQSSELVLNAVTLYDPVTLLNCNNPVYAAGSGLGY